MRLILIAHLILYCASVVGGQSTEQPKTIKAVDPVFPEGAKDYIYGERIRVTVDIDKHGRVTAARTFGPLEPCANRNDVVLAAIRTAALEAVNSTIYAPVLDVNGKPSAARLNVSYRLRPPEKVLPDELKRTIIGGFLNSKATSLPQPAYPAGIKAEPGNDQVMVSVLIGEDGSVLSAGAWSGNRDLMSAAVDAACQARFPSTTLKGQPAKVTGVIRYRPVQ